MHVAGVYDGVALRLYAAGTLIASRPACPYPPCGNISYPPPVARVRPADCFCRLSSLLPIYPSLVYALACGDSMCVRRTDRRHGFGFDAR